VEAVDEDVDEDEDRAEKSTPASITDMSRAEIAW